MPPGVASVLYDGLATTRVYAIPGSSVEIGKRTLRDDLARGAREAIALAKLRDEDSVSRRPTRHLAVHGR